MKSASCSFCLTARDLADMEDLVELGGYSKELNGEAAGGGVIAALGPTGTRDWRELRERVLNSEYMKWVAWALTLGKGGGVPTEIPSTYDWWEMANAFFNCTDPKTQPEFLYRRGSLVRLSENCLAADSTEIKLVSFVAGRVTDKSDGADLAEPGEMLGFGFGCDF